jgi:hypothetical protein
MNHLKMLEGINALLDTDFGLDMEMKFYRVEKYTQKEARRMTLILAKVFSISHCLSCPSCASRKGYNLKQK